VKERLDIYDKGGKGIEPIEFAMPDALPSLGTGDAIQPCGQVSGRAGRQENDIPA
jgi:hypothetical protein